MTGKNFRYHRRGSSLVEAVIAVGVLAVAVPLVLGTLAEASKSSSLARAETRASWIVQHCVREIEASRQGRSQLFAASQYGDELPPAGETWALVFAADGKLLGKASSSQYQQGIKKIADQSASYLATIEAKKSSIGNSSPPMLDAQIRIEYPAAAKQARRSKLDFHTRIP